MHNIFPKCLPEWEFKYQQTVWGWPSCHSAALGAALESWGPGVPLQGWHLRTTWQEKGWQSVLQAQKKLELGGRLPGCPREGRCQLETGSGDRRQGPSGSPGMLILESCGKGSGDSSPLQKAIPSQGIRSSHRRELGRRGELGGRSRRVPKKANPGGIDPAELVFFSCLGLCGVF